MKASVTSTETLKFRRRQRIGFRGDEVLDIGVVAAHGRHHRAPGANPPT